MRTLLRVAFVSIACVTLAAAAAAAGTPPSSTRCPSFVAASGVFDASYFDIRATGVSCARADDILKRFPRPWHCTEHTVTGREGRVGVCRRGTRRISFVVDSSGP